MMPQCWLRREVRPRPISTECPVFSHDFAHAKLEIETIPTGRTFGRIYRSSYPDPLGYGKLPSPV